MAGKKNELKIIAQHRKASFEYEIIDTYEAGIVLTGTEIKSLRQGNAVIRDGHISIREGEAWVHNLHIPEYSHGNRENHVPTRKRKLLLHHREIDRIRRKISQQGFTAFPLRLYFKGHRVKLEIGIGRGKKLYDKRQSEKEKSARREMRDRY